MPGRLPAWDTRQLRLVCTQIQSELPVELWKKILAHLLEDRFTISSLSPKCNRTLQRLHNNLTRRAITDPHNWVQFIGDQRFLKRKAFKLINVLGERLLQQWNVNERDRKRPERMQKPDECALPWINALNLEATPLQIMEAAKSKFVGTVLKDYGDQMRKLKQAQKARGAAEGYLMALKLLPLNDSLAKEMEAQQKRVVDLGRECIKQQRAILYNPMRPAALAHYFARKDRDHEARLKQNMMRGLLMARVRAHNHLADFFFE